MKVTGFTPPSGGPALPQTATPYFEKLPVTEMASCLLYLTLVPNQSDWAGKENWLDKRYAEIYPGLKQDGKFRVKDYQWRTLHFNGHTRQSTAKVMAAYREDEPGSVCLMQQPHCVAVPYVKSMISNGLASISSSDSDLIPDVINGERNMNILCIGHGGGSLPLFLASKIRGAVVHIVEIDPIVISASVQAMGFPAFSVMTPSGQRASPKPDPIDEVLWKGTHERLLLFNSDAEKFILNSTSNYDIVFIDAYDGDDIFPHKLWDVDSPFIGALAHRLHPDHGTVVVNLHSDADATDTSNPPFSPNGQNISKVCNSYKDALLGNETFANGVAYTVSVPWLCNTTLVVSKGCGALQSSSGGWSMIFNALMSKALEVDKLVEMPFSCLQYIMRDFTPID